MSRPELSLLVAFSMLGLLGSAAQGDEVTPIARDGRLRFELDVMPILTVAGCNQGACHGKARGQNGFALSLLGYDPDFDFAAISQEGRGRRVFPAAPESSLLLLKGSAQLPHGGGARLKVGEAHYETLRRWIAEGMHRATADDPQLVSIRVSPDERPLKQGEQVRLTVTGEYSDGQQRDVTSLAAFQSSDTPIATVEQGVITAGKLPGETVVMTRFMGRIATWSVVIPSSQSIDPNAYAALPRVNYIDDLAWAKLREVGVLPSPPASPEKLHRRLYLDLIGRLPTPEETRSYLADTRPDKRARLIDVLLDRPEYADHWANKWADLLRPNPFHAGMKATLTMDTWLRESYRQNWPYDRFVRELLTAQGGTFTNGAVTFYRNRREPDELTTMVSQLFLGIRLECAKCHQHPFEVYGQNDFYSFAAYFNRMGRKGQGISAPISGGEEFVFVNKAGKERAVLHPLTGETMTPRPLFGTAREVGPNDDPRAVLVEWMVSAENPYFAQVQVNRLWADLMGRGLVEPVDDLRATNPPSNAPLLLALADDFRRHGFDQKHLLRTIANSHVYGLSSLPNGSNVGDTRNYSRHYRSRLRGETLLDAVTDITSIPESFSAMPAESRATQLWTHRIGSLFLDSFGRPDPNQDPPCERTSETTMVQALHLMNAPNMHRKVTDGSGQIARLANSMADDRALLDELYLWTYARYPSVEEREALLPLFAGTTGEARRLRAEDLTWALINTPEFVFKD